MTIYERLISLSDASYQEFQRKLIPTLDGEKIIGVRMPEIRRLAKEVYNTNEKVQFLNALPHKTYDENNLHAALICLEKDFDVCIKLLDEFLPYVDNWATCDMMGVGVLKKEPCKTLEKVTEWINSPHTYTRRFAILVLLKYFADENFKEEYLALVNGAVTNDYYVKMIIAWYNATLIAKHFNITFNYLKAHVTDEGVIKKTVQKCRESYRLTNEEKALIKTLLP